MTQRRLFQKRPGKVTFQVGGNEDNWKEGNNEGVKEEKHMAMKV